MNIYPAAQIYAFEPNPRLHAKLVAKYGNNKQIHLFANGISDHAGELELQETLMDETSTFESLNYNSDYLKMKSSILGVSPQEIVTKSHVVSVIRLCDFISDNQIVSIDILKIDTEGH